MATYIAITDGYLGKEKGLIRAGDTFDWDGPVGSWMKDANEPIDSPDENQGLTRKDIIRELDTLNIAYFKGAKTEVLQSILDEALRASGKA